MNNNNSILEEINIEYLKKLIEYDEDDIPIVINKDKNTINKIKKIVDSFNTCACLKKITCECKDICECEDDVYYTISTTEFKYPNIKLLFTESIDLLKKEYSIKIFTYNQL